MELTIGHRAVDAKILEEGTYLSEKSGKEFRDLMMEFVLAGPDALGACERYYELSLDAVKFGVLAEDVFWTSTVYVSEWEQVLVTQGGSVSQAKVYKVVWRLREDEDQN